MTGFDFDGMFSQVHRTLAGLPDNLTKFVASRVQTRLQKYGVTFQNDTFWALQKYRVEQKFNKKKKTQQNSQSVFYLWFNWRLAAQTEHAMKPVIK